MEFLIFLSLLEYICSCWKKNNLYSILIICIYNNYLYIKLYDCEQILLYEIVYKGFQKSFSKNKFFILKFGFFYLSSAFS